MHGKLGAAIALCVGLLAGCGGAGDASDLLNSGETTATLTVNRDGLGIVTSDIGSLTCPEDCDDTYPVGSVVTLTAAAGAGHTFTGWNGDGVSCGSSATCELPLTASLTITATFSEDAATQRQLNVTISGSGVVNSSPTGIACPSTTCNAAFADGASVTLNAVPASGYRFTGWSGGGCTGTSTSCTLTMSATRGVTATFAVNAPVTRTLSVGITGSGAVGSSPAGINCDASCSAAFADGSIVTLGAAPASGFQFAGWTGACSGTGACAITMSAARSVGATFTPVAVNTVALNVVLNGTGTVTSAPAGINCGTSCSASFASGTSVTLSAVPGTGYTFTGWVGGGCTGTGSCTVSVSASTSVAASFAQIRYTLSVSKNGSGTVTSSVGGINCGTTCSASFTPSTSVVLTATPSSGYAFAGWSGGVCSGTGTCTVSMSAARSITATFTQISYALTVAVTGSGSVGSLPAGISCGATCSANYTSGTSVTLTATPATGYRLSAWGGACTGSGTCIVAMSAARSVTATFVVIPANELTVTLAGSGTVSSSPAGIACGSTCAAVFPENTAVTLTATAASGYTFTGWSGACTGTGACAVTMAAARAVTATFTQVTYSLAVTVGGSGSVVSSPTGINCGTACNVPFGSGTTVTLTATPASGYGFAGWSGACTGTGSCAVTMSAARSVTATFTQITHVLSASVTGSGAIGSSPAGISCGSTCSASYASGTTVTLAASPVSGYQFASWGGACSGTGACTVTMSAARSVSANFTAVAPTTHALSVSFVGTGTVTSAPTGVNCTSNCSATFNAGTAVTLTAAPASGYAFTGWSGACTGSGTCAVTMSAARAVTANFAADVAALTVTAQGLGTITSNPAGINCGTSCTSSYSIGAGVVLTATATSGNQFSGWSGACSGASATCTVTMSQGRTVGASFVPTSTGQFGARPYLFKAVEARLKASIAAGDPEATGSAANNAGTPVGFITLARAAHANRAGYDDISTWQIALAGWLVNDTAMMQRARDEAMAIVNAAPGGDSGTSDAFQHVEDRLLLVAATADLAYSQYSSSQLAQVATWVNGTLDNWNRYNLSFWPYDEPRNNYWQNGFLAHAIGGIATQGYNSRAAEWRTKTASMAAKFTAATTGANWSGPVQSEGHYYSAYVGNALWAMELYDAAMGTDLVGTAQFSIPAHLNLVMYQTRPHLLQFFEVGSEANNSLAPYTQNTIGYWHHLIHSGQFTPEARVAKTILATALADNGNFWSRSDKGFVNFYWNLRGVAGTALSSKTDRMFVAPTPGAGLIGLRSAAGFQTTARAAVMFANQFASEAAYSHANPDAPGFQWASGADWLVTDPEFYANSGILAEAGSGVYSDVSNIVTLAGQKYNESGSYPQIRHAEDNSSASVPHYYTSINAQPYWTSASTYRREYVWLDDLQVVAIFDRIVGGGAKTWRLHVPAAPTISGNTASYSINGKTVTVRNLQATGGGAWASANLNGTTTQRNVWRLSQADASSDYRSVKVLDVGGRVSAATLVTGSGYQEAQITINGVTRAVRFFDDGSHATVQ